MTAHAQFERVQRPGAAEREGGTLARVAIPRFDLTDLDTYRDGFPHDAFTALRREAPLYWHPPTAHTPDGVGFWVISRHADVLAIQLDPERFSSDRAPGGPPGGTMIADNSGAGLMLNMMDDPRHRRIRGLVSKGFTPRVIGGLEPDLRRRTRAILGALPPSGECDFVVDVARQLPLQAICQLLGIPQEDRDMLCEWMDRGMESEAGAVMNREYGEKLSRYGVGLIAERRAKPGDDLLSAVIGAEMPEEAEPRLGDAELTFFFTLLFTAGSETTRKAIAGGLRALVENPEQLERLRAQPALLGSAIEEIVRWTTPSVYKRRTATCDVALYGETIRAGDKLTFWEMSANRDERVFAEPFRFDVARDPNPHLGFGQGVHYCIGANLARLEMRVMFEELFARFSRFEITGPAAWTRENRLLGLKHLPMRLTRA
jgi:cytochrome P450